MSLGKRGITVTWEMFLYFAVAIVGLIIFIWIAMSSNNSILGDFLSQFFGFLP
ncbi:hypothetical protein JXB02_03890 [Candidatus Woesearchaeota archaeon]|nr:hypothetical protein [Candidatus Woesearchaeota archaeon]